MGSEMCIRDRVTYGSLLRHQSQFLTELGLKVWPTARKRALHDARVEAVQAQGVAFLDLHVVDAHEY